MERSVSFQLTILGHRPVFTARESRQVNLRCKGVKTGQPSLQGSQDRPASAARESRQELEATIHITSTVKSGEQCPYACLVRSWLSLFLYSLGSNPVNGVTHNG